MLFLFALLKQAFISINYQLYKILLGFALFCLFFLASEASTVLFLFVLLM